MVGAFFCELFRIRQSLFPCYVGMHFLKCFGGYSGNEYPRHYYYYRNQQYEQSKCIEWL